MARIRAAGPILVVACLLWSGWAPGARGADAIDAELIGFLAQIPRDGLRLPPPAPATATLEVPNEQGGPRIVFPLEFTPRTGPGRARLVRPGDLVLLEGVIQGGRMRVTQVRDVEIAEFKGRLSLPDGPLSLPLAADRLVDVVLEGARVPIGFLITPRTTGPRTTLRDGQSVALAVVVSGRIVIDLDPR